MNEIDKPTYLYEGELEIPYEALREGVINALCHRRYDDYREGLQLGIYNDRVEICNPGRFPVGVTPENIKTLHSSKPRNLHIAQVMYKAAYLEGWGTGIKRMIDVCKAHNLPEPFYQIWADGTIVLTFLRPKTANNGETNGETNGKWKYLTERQNSIIQCLQKNGTHTSRTLSILLDISQRTVEREISFLRTNGYIDKEGSTKNGTWKVLK